MTIFPTAENCCPVCCSKEIEVFFETLQVPVHCGLLWSSLDDALNAPRGDVRLGFCRSCTHVYNLSFNPALLEYSQPYDNSLHFSAHFQNYVHTLAERLIERYDLHGKDIVEVGSGLGDFLRLLCERGGNRGVGFDPSFTPRPAEPGAGGMVTFIQDYFSEAYRHQKADLILSRQVLEHMENPSGFLSMLRSVIGERLNTVVFLEVPNYLYPRPGNAAWDVIYEHYSNFTARSLARLAAVCGFDILEHSESFDRLFLTIDLKPAVRAAGDPVLTDWGETEAAGRQVKELADSHRRSVAEWQGRIAEIQVSGRKVAAWGAGARGLSFLNLLHIDQGSIPYIVDINPRKWGKYIAGTGQEIVAPDFLREYRPDTIIIINPVYKDEIAGAVAKLGLEVEFWYA